MATKTGVVGASMALRQLTGALIGGILLLILSRLDYRRLRPLAWPLLVVTIVLLLIPVLPGTARIAPMINGARRWIQYGVLSFQPSEIARLVVVIWCAVLAAKKGEQLRQFKKGVLPFLVVLGLIFLLVLLEPNLSMATLIVLLGMLVVFTAGAKIGHFILLAALGLMLVFSQIRDAQYRLARFTTFLNPGDGTSEAGFQIHQSLVGIGSGGVFGSRVSDRASRSWVTCPTPIPISCSAPSARSGASSASSSWCCSTRCSAGWDSASPVPRRIPSDSTWPPVSPSRSVSPPSCTWP